MTIEAGSVIESSDVLEEIVKVLPELPSVIRYYDDYTDQTHSIRMPSTSKRWLLIVDGATRSFAFDGYADSHAYFWKSYLTFRFSSGVQNVTVSNEFDAIKHIAGAELVRLLSCPPDNFAIYWEGLRAKNLPSKVYTLVRNMLRMMSEYCIGGWGPSHSSFIERHLPIPTADKFRTVRTGDAFLSAREEALVIKYLDEVSQPAVLESLDPDDLVDAVALLCCYQHGVRMKQMALVQIDDVDVWSTRKGDNSVSTVHIRFRMLKQRDTALKGRMLRRKVKTEWAGIVARQKDLATRTPNQNRRLLALPDLPAGRRRLSDLLERITGRRLSAGHLRHTAALRLVDAGANKEELADFLGHSDLATGLVYYDASANQAARINKALGLSDTYRKIVEVAHAGFISPEELANLKGEQQIAGAPHGIPIAGIGGCTSGQPACPYNPITSCYGCRKFMPVRDINVHAQVLEDMRGVVHTFYNASRQETKTPAYMQLRRTISEIEAVMDELEEKK